MKRRTFNLLAGTSLTALAVGSRNAAAQTAPDAGLLKTTLTPLGAERAGNAAGTIPAWTGGMTATPAGITWNSSSTLPPDFWPDEKPLYVVNQGNLSQYASLLSDGVQTLITKRGMSLNVYPTHRTMAAPQWMYDNTALNVARAQLDSAGGRFGFTGAFGGIPFPILDTATPLNGGAQAIWNHEARWRGSYETNTSGSFVIVNRVLSLSQATSTIWDFPYYAPNGSPETYDGYSYRLISTTTGPAADVGSQIMHYESSNTRIKPNISWQLLSGQGRVRKAPEVEYDTPSSSLDGLCNYDEYYGFNGAADRYDWKLIGKQEMLVPYNGNKLINTPSTVALGPDFVNPDSMRWELHRVWVVEATLHPGERNVIARHQLYIDEDCWTVLLSDGYDANGNLFHQLWTTLTMFPNLPALISTNSFIYNMQTNNYGSLGGPFADPPFNAPWLFEPNSPANYNPQTMAAAANY